MEMGVGSLHVVGTATARVFYGGVGSIIVQERQPHQCNWPCAHLLLLSLEASPLLRLRLSSIQWAHVSLTPSGTQCT